MLENAVMDDSIEEGRQRALEEYRRAIAEYRPKPVPAPKPKIMTDAITNLYSVFNRYPSRSKTSPNHTLVPKEALSKRLTDLTADDLKDYGLFWENVDDFRHFLPRVIELTTEAESVQLPMGVVYSSLTYALWRSWPKDEQDAIERFLDSWWKATLSFFPCSWGLDDVVSALACVYPCLRPYFLELSSLSTAVSFQHFVESNCFEFCTLTEAQEVQRNEWLFSEETMTWLEGGYYLFMDEPWSDEIWKVVNYIVLQAAYRKAH
jgi:hypothetical protein